MQETFGAGDQAIRHVLFDMDNTLWDFVGAKREACRAVVEDLGAGDADALYQYFRRPGVGYEDLQNIRDYLSGLGAEREAYGRACWIYERAKLTTIRLFDGVEETLEAIAGAGLTMAVVTDAYSFQALTRLEQTGIKDYFSYLVTPDLTGRKKPDPVQFRCALHALSADPAETMVVGDSIRREVAPARALGMQAAYALYGDHSEGPEPICRPDYVLEEIRDLIPALGI